MFKSSLVLLFRHPHGGLQSDLHHGGEGGLALCGIQLLPGNEAVGDGEDGKAPLAQLGGVHVKSRGLHLHCQHAHLRPFHSGAGGIIEGVGAEDVAHGHVHAVFPGHGHGGLQQGVVCDGGEGAGEAVLVGEVGVGACSLGGNDVPELQAGADGSGGADADDVVHAVLGEQLIGVDADGGHPHAGGHNGDGYILVGAGIAVDAPDVVDQPGVVQEGVGDELGPQGVAGHEDGLGEIAGVGGIVRSRHMVFPFLC